MASMLWNILPPEVRLAPIILMYCKSTCNDAHTNGAMSIWLSGALSTCDACGDARMRGAVHVCTHVCTGQLLTWPGANRPQPSSGSGPQVGDPCFT